jgi:hypothetical protein
MQLDVAIVVYPRTASVCLERRTLKSFGTSLCACNSHPEISLDANFTQSKLSLFFICVVCVALHYAILIDVTQVQK